MHKADADAVHVVSVATGYTNEGEIYVCSLIH